MSTEKRRGPRLTIAASCQGCVYEHSEHYCIEDGNDVDSGVNVCCTHPAQPFRPNGRIGDTTWKTPEWCPLLAEATAALLSGAQVTP